VAHYNHLLDVMRKIFTLPLVEERSHMMSLSDCLSLCVYLSAVISKEPHIQTALQSIHYLLPVL